MAIVAEPRLRFQKAKSSIHKRYAFYKSRRPFPKTSREFQAVAGTMIGEASWVSGVVGAYCWVAMIRADGVQEHT